MGHVKPRCAKPTRPWAAGTRWPRKRRRLGGAGSSWRAGEEHVTAGRCLAASHARAAGHAPRRAPGHTVEELRAFIVDRFQEVDDRVQRLEDDVAEHKDTISEHLKAFTKDRDVFASIRHHVTEQQVDAKLKAPGEHARLVGRHHELLRQLLLRIEAQLAEEGIVVPMDVIIADSAFAKDALLTIGGQTPYT